MRANFAKQITINLVWVLASMLLCFCVYWHLRPVFHFGWEYTLLAGMLAVGSVEFLLFAITVFRLTLIAFGRMAVPPDYEQQLEAEWSMEKGFYHDKSNWEERDSWDDRAKCRRRVEELERVHAEHQTLKKRMAAIDLRWGDFRGQCSAMRLCRRVWWVFRVAMVDRCGIWGGVIRRLVKAVVLLAYAIAQVCIRPVILYWILYWIIRGVWWGWWKIRRLQAPFVALFTFLISRGRIDSGLVVIVSSAVVLNELFGIMWPAFWLARGCYWTQNGLDNFARMDWGHLAMLDSQAHAKQRREWERASMHHEVWGSLIERWGQIPYREGMSRFPGRYAYACREVMIDRYLPRSGRRSHMDPGSTMLQ